MAKTTKPKQPRLPRIPDSWEPTDALGKLLERLDARDVARLCHWLAERGSAALPFAKHLYAIADLVESKRAVGTTLAPSSVGRIGGGGGEDWIDDRPRHVVSTVEHG